MEYLESLLDYSSPDKIDIIVYNTIEDLAQTNVGIYQNIYNIGGTNSVLGSKIYVYFNGNHRDMINNLRKSIMSLLIDAMMAGNSLQEMLNVIISFDLPEWFKPGLLSYHSKDWDATDENTLRTFFKVNKKPNFKNLTQQNSQLAGHSMFNYIHNKYGAESIKNLVYLTRINRNINSGVAYALDITLERLILDWELEMSRRFKTENYKLPDERFKISIKSRKNRILDQVKISPNSNYISYILRLDGFYKVMMYDIEKKKAKKIERGGIRSDSYPFDFSTPLTAWERSSKQFTLFREKKDYTQVTLLDPETFKKSKIEIRGFQKIHSVNYINANTLVLSAQKNGYTDIYTYNINNSRTINITSDFYDDLEPNFVDLGNQKGIIFSSNRLDDTLRKEGINQILPTGTFDLFFYDLDKPGNILTRITQTPTINEKNPIQADSGRYAFLSDQNGVYNMFMGYVDSFYLGYQQVLVTKSGDKIMNPSKSLIDSLSSETDSIYSTRRYKQKGITYPVTDYSVNINNLSGTRQGQSYLLSLSNRNLTENYKIPVDAFDNQTTLEISDFRKTDHGQRKKFPLTSSGQEEVIELGKNAFDSIYFQPFKYTFESKFNNILGLKDTVSAEQKEEEFVTEASSYDNQTLVTSKQIRSSRTIAYKAKFASKSFSTQLDNAIRITPYQNIATASPSFTYPSLGGFFSYHLHDVMEDHNIIAGFKIPFDFNGSELFIKYDNLKKRVDKSILFYRRSQLEGINYFDDVTGIFLGSGQGRSQTYYSEAALTYPLDVIRSFRLSASYRHDRLIPLTNDDAGGGLSSSTSKENWVATKFEYIHDNSKEPVLNLPQGFKYKIFFEYFQNAKNLSGNTFNLGWDLRFYQKIWRNVIFATRFAGASSFGNKKILYFLGGVDSWLNQSVNNNIPVTPGVEYSFMALANNMRGFQQNIRNGNGFTLLNLEIRAALFSSIAKKNINSAFIRNFQFIGFMDIGSAYRGLTPFNEDNPYTEEEIPVVGPVEIITRYFRNPTVMSFGSGVRTTFLGYFIKLDIGWGYDGRIISSKPRFDFSISKDF